jgi:hypothetical protein
MMLLDLKRTPWLEPYMYLHMGHHMQQPVARYQRARRPR